MKSSIALCTVVLALGLLSPRAFAQAPTTAAPATAPQDQTPAAATSESSDTLKMAKVFFVEPKDKATVGKTFPVKFGVSGIKVAPAGAITPGTGHFHLIIDAPAVNKGEVIGADDKHIHYGKGQTETTLTLASGKHTLTLQFADGAHRSYGPGLVQTITVTVK